LVTLVTATSAASMLTTLFLSLSILVMMLFINKTRNYRLGGFLVSVVFCDAGFPFVFFTSGGIHSGMLAYLLLGTVIISLLLSGADFVIMLALYLIINATCFFAQMTGFVQVLPIKSELMFYVDVTASFIIASVMIGIVLKYQKREYVMAQRAAEDASKAKSEFLSNMSHEMRTPMNAIIGMTAIGKAALDAERKDYAFLKIEAASTHLLGVINDILDMSKIEAGKLEISSAEFDFEKMLQKVVSVVNFRAEERRQNLSVYIDSAIPRLLIGDDQRLAQVITNLLSNAVKFTPEGGKISLEAHLAGEENGCCKLRIEVRDTGIGISPEQRARLFTSFQQAESSTSRQYGGTGLGLSISKSIVNMLGGQIWLESELGKGSTFAFTAQVKRSAKEEGADILPLGVNRGKIRALLAGGGAETQEYFTEIAFRLGLSRDAAAGGGEALALLEKGESYDIYFINRTLPDMDGLELTRLIRKKMENSVVVLMASSAEWGAVENEARKAGARTFLPKPLFPSAVADCLRECLTPEDGRAEDGQGAEADDFSACRVLLAEDVEINREIVLSLLEPTRLRIDCAENGTEAVRIFSAAPAAYDMIFMDLQMPEMDGFEATRRIRALAAPQGQEIPIIAMTANVFREDVEKCLAAGMNGHIGKPLDLDDVLLSLREHLPCRDGRGLRRAAT
ncbi:MAG: response regulator, partial [Gracilibacteraceae bacterium]|nr:response regulator [Gracilibacteraceae bacterium]